MVLGKDGWCWERLELRKDEREIKVQPTNRMRENMRSGESWQGTPSYCTRYYRTSTSYPVTLLVQNVIRQFITLPQNKAF